MYKYLIKLVTKLLSLKFLQLLYLIFLGGRLTRFDLKDVATNCDSHFGFWHFGLYVRRTSRSIPLADFGLYCISKIQWLFESLLRSMRLIFRSPALKMVSYLQLCKQEMKPLNEIDDESIFQYPCLFNCQTFFVTPTRMQVILGCII